MEQYSKKKIFIIALTYFIISTILVKQFNIPLRYNSPFQDRILSTFELTKNILPHLIPYFLSIPFPGVILAKIDCAEFACVETVPYNIQIIIFSLLYLYFAFYFLS